MCYLNIDKTTRISLLILALLIICFPFPSCKNSCVLLSEEDVLPIRLDNISDSNLTSLNYGIPGSFFFRLDSTEFSIRTYSPMFRLNSIFNSKYKKEGDTIKMLSKVEKKPISFGQNKTCVKNNHKSMVIKAYYNGIPLYNVFYDRKKQCRFSLNDETRGDLFVYVQIGKEFVSLNNPLSRVLDINQSLNNHEIVLKRDSTDLKEVYLIIENIKFPLKYYCDNITMEEEKNDSSTLYEVRFDVHRMLSSLKYLVKNDSIYVLDWNDNVLNTFAKISPYIPLEKQKVIY